MFNVLTKQLGRGYISPIGKSMTTCDRFLCVKQKTYRKIIGLNTCLLKCMSFIESIQQLLRRITSFESVISRTIIECKQSIILRIFLLIYFTLIKNTFAEQCCSDPNNTITYCQLSLNCVETSSQRLQISQYLHCFMNDIRQLSTRC